MRMKPREVFLSSFPRTSWCNIGKAEFFMAADVRRATSFARIGILFVANNTTIRRPSRQTRPPRAKSQSARVNCHFPSLLIPMENVLPHRGGV